MSDSFETTSPSGSDVPPQSPSGKADAAKHEAADLKDAATGQAKDVLGTAKEEAASVVTEAKTQAKDLFAQTQRELTEQAHTQQQRLAGGLRSVSDELDTMAANSDGTGIAGDLVQQVSGRLSAAAAWLGDRDPGSVLTEVKRFARRKPGTFILAAAVAGIVVGRLTRALAANASDDKDSTPTTTSTPAAAPTEVHPDPSVPVPVGPVAGSPSETPLYAQTASTRPNILGEGDDDRSHTV